MKNHAIVFLAWGEKYIHEVSICIHRSRPYIENYDLILITDQSSITDKLEPDLTHLIRADFEQSGLLRKTEILKFLPNHYDSFLFLDSDTIVIQDISLGFAKAVTHGIAVCPAPHYSLEAFSGFDKIMQSAGVPRLGQLQYNTGVIFFRSCPEVREVLTKWGALASKYSNFKNDQPFFTLAMETLEFNPYTLSISFNYRGFGDAISGDVRIWHSHGKMPRNINDYSVIWPPRRAWPNKMRGNHKCRYRLVVWIKKAFRLFR